MVSIDIRHLTKRFGDVTALEEVDLRIESGELFFLLGPSGCGKTTLLRTIAGFYTPQEGEILFDGENVATLPPHLRGTAMMFQSYALWPHMTVGKNVAFGLEQLKTPRPETEERVAEALGMVQMADYADRRINELSGGQQQRVALAAPSWSALAASSSTSPLSNLDAKLRLEMRSEIRRICKEFGLTAVYVTHDQKEALSMADRMAVLEKGRVAQVGTPQDVYRNPRTRSVASFIGETNFIDGTVRGPADKGYFRVDTRIGEFVGRSPDGEAYFDEDIVILSIRPEALTIDPHADLGTIAPNTITAASSTPPTSASSPSTPSPPTGIRTRIHISELNPAHLLPPGDVPLCATVRSEDVILLPPQPLSASVQPVP